MGAVLQQGFAVRLHVFHSTRATSQQVYSRENSTLVTRYRIWIEVKEKCWGKKRWKKLWKRDLGSSDLWRKTETFSQSWFDSLLFLNRNKLHPLHLPGPLPFYKCWKCPLIINMIYEQSLYTQTPDPWFSQWSYLEEILGWHIYKVTMK